MFYRIIKHRGPDGAETAIDIDRAMWLMDKSVLADAVEVLPTDLGQDLFDRFIAVRMGFTPNKTCMNIEVLQMLWDEYCRLHLRKYKKEFNPDVM